ncbi:hypothetical protein GE300_00965 [Rhodobacteraceae bacterium 2CG4]|uniref:Lysozyme inhibitor LprI N-terminal domain-containing protein n=1 Tax=Halovulum marinum TaxID=2662447 RepID=A0A6L5YX01_9RHOB|nr:hypothetical protein [Halovulum marinum]MSU88184.1 hypothetical protein [Halovulum marinum]
MRRAAPILGCALILAPAAAAQNRQPISTSMVECAAIYGEMAGVAERRRRDAADIRLIRDGAARFAEAAADQARAEGHADAQAHLSPVYAGMARKWDGRLANPLHLFENRNWINYCRALGRDRGILD